MKIKVLQGLNLINPHTTVIVEMEKVSDELVKMIKEIHPIFLIDYKIHTEAKLEVQTHIPNLWKNEQFLQPIEDYATGKIDYEKARLEMLEVARLLLGSMSTIPTLHAAHKKGYETIQYFVNDSSIEKLSFNRTYSIGIGLESEVMTSASSTRDAHLAQKIQRDKSITNQVIEKMGMPIAKWAIVDSKEKLKDLGDKVGYPLVMKPVGLTGGHGVQIGMKNSQELEEAWDRIQSYYEKDMTHQEKKSEWQKTIIIQQVLKGSDYRILVVNGKFQIATHRLQAQVTGDGSSSIEELIKKENENPARDINLPTHTLKPIVIDKDLIKVLEKQNLNINYIPKKDEVVRVRDVASMSQGGITADVTDKIHPQIKYICESIAQTIHAFVLGVDVLAQDISKPLTTDNGGIIEMNTMPEIYLNTHPVIGTKREDFGELILQNLINQNIHTNRVVVLGDISYEKIEKNVTEQLPGATKIGRFYNNTIYINGFEINSKLSIHTGVLCMKKNKSLDTIVLHYQDIQEIEENGLGFDNIDLLISTEETINKVKADVQKYLDEKLIKRMIIV
ncbi:ATP-grasp domain-containing protein [Candidatus Dojkabacteria bacterium]|nr:ATP-grasp domain-containing protein [Candidatus Dojkabacteria bacterium]